MTYTHREFFTEFLLHLELPVTDAALRALAVVSIFESSQGNEKWNNPLAVEQTWPRATNYNTAGVKVYATFYDGVDATAEMFRGPHWAGVRQAIADTANGATRGHVLRAFNAAYTWVTVDFTALPYNTITDADTRLAHTLNGPL